MQLPTFGGLALCRPPSTQDWILIVAITLAVFVLLFFTLVRVVERSYINRDKSAVLGRQVGIFGSLALALAAMLATGYLTNGCLHPRFLIWLAAMAVVVLVDGLYTWVVASRD